MFKRDRLYTSEKGVMGFHFIMAGTARLIITSSLLVIMFSLPCFAEEKLTAVKFPPPVLKKAALCEKITHDKPVYEGVVFSADIQKLFCFTHFEPVYGKSDIFHKYYFKDEFISKTRLSIKQLKQPSFSTYSMIQLRESDIGPWRVEITDAEDNILTTIRFSITD
jgi:hypothetical protein